MVEMIEIHQNHNFALCVEFPLIHTLLGENTQQNKVVHVDHVAQHVMVAGFSALPSSTIQS